MLEISKVENYIKTIDSNINGLNTIKKNYETQIENAISHNDSISVPGWNDEVGAKFISHVEELKKSYKLIENDVTQGNLSSLIELINKLKNKCSEYINTYNSNPSFPSLGEEDKAKYKDGKRSEMSKEAKNAISNYEKRKKERDLTLEECERVINELLALIKSVSFNNTIDTNIVENPIEIEEEEEEIEDDEEDEEEIDEEELIEKHNQEAMANAKTLDNGLKYVDDYIVVDKDGEEHHLQVYIYEKYDTMVYYNPETNQSILCTPYYDGDTQDGYNMWLFEDNLNAYIGKEINQDLRNVEHCSGENEFYNTISTMNPERLVNTTGQKFHRGMTWGKSVDANLSNNRDMIGWFF